MQWMIDASISNDEAFVFLPVDPSSKDPDGLDRENPCVAKPSFPPAGEIMGVVHPDGREDARAWVRDHCDSLDAMFAVKQSDGDKK